MLRNCLCSRLAAGPRHRRRVVDRRRGLIKPGNRLLDRTSIGIPSSERGSEHVNHHLAVPEGTPSHTSLCAQLFNEFLLLQDAIFAFDNSVDGFHQVGNFDVHSARSFHMMIPRGRYAQCNVGQTGSRNAPDDRWVCADQERKDWAASDGYLVQLGSGTVWPKSAHAQLCSSQPVKSEYASCAKGNNDRPGVEPGRQPSLLQGLG